MARDPYIEQRLINWAKWLARGSTGGLGYAGTAWDAFDAGDRYGTGRAPVVQDGEEAITDQAVRSLDDELQAALVLRYAKTGTDERKANEAGCHLKTFRTRVAIGERGVSAWLTERERAAAAERERVEALGRQVSAAIDRRQAEATDAATEIGRPKGRKRRGGFTPLH